MRSREEMRLLDAEVGAGEVELQVRGVPDRRDIARSVPGGANAEELAEGGQFAGLLSPPMSEMWTRMKSIRRSWISGTYSAWLTKSSPIAIGIARLLAEEREVAVVLRRERVFEEEEPVLLQLLRQPDRQDRRHPLVDVVQQLDLVAERDCGGARTA